MTRPAAVAALAWVTSIACSQAPGPDHYRAESERRLSEGGGLVAKMRAVSREVAELHLFFKAWFRGELPDSDEAFSRFSNVMAPEFVLVRPDGTESRQPNLIASLRAAHGSNPDIEIRIENDSLIVHEGDLLVARYDEIQQTGGETTRRLSTVVFRIRAGTPNDLEWVRVHETWAEGSPPDPH